MKSLFRGCGIGVVVCLAVVSVAGQTPASTTSADWRQWRGPSRDGIVGATLPAEWPATLTRRWEVPVGTGHSSPVVAGTRVIVMSREGEREVVRALELASGKELWKTDYDAPYTVNSAAASHGPGPKATPVVSGGRVFTFGISGVLSAFDLASGKLLWRIPSPKVLPQYGTGMSPMVDGDVVIAHVGGNNSGAVTAFDVAKGTVRWQWNGDGPGYGSPVIATIGGVKQLITITQKLLVGLNAADGRLLWQLPFTTSYNQNSITPIVRGDVVVYSGLDKPATAIRVTRKGTEWTTEPVWANAETPMFMSSPVRIGGTLFGLTQRNRGQFVALEAATGKTLWATKGREGENASIMGNSAWLLMSTTDGVLVIAKADPKAYTEVRRYKIAESAVWAHPAIAGRSLVVKDANKVICWTF